MYEMIMFCYFFFHFSGWCTILELMNCYVRPTVDAAWPGFLFPKVVVLTAGSSLFICLVVKVSVDRQLNVIGNFGVLCSFFSCPWVHRFDPDPFFCVLLRALVGIRLKPIAGKIKPRGRVARRQSLHPLAVDDARMSWFRVADCPNTLEVQCS